MSYSRLYILLEEKLLYHVVFDFLEHVVIGHDEFLGCVAVGDVS